MGLFIYHRELIIQSGLRSALFDDNLWSPFSTSIIKTVGKCLPTSVTSLTIKLKKKYMKMRMNLLCLVNRDVSQLTIDSPNQRQEAQLILQIMSFRYIETFHKLTAVPSMGELRSSTTTATEIEEDIDCREHNAILAELDADDDPENEVSRKITTSLDEDSDNESDNGD